MIWDYFIEFSHRINLLYLAITYIITIVFFHKKYFRKSLLFHPSAKLDYQYFVVIFFIKSFVIMPLIFSATSFALHIALLLEDYFGYQEINRTFSRFQIAMMYTFCLFLLSDFSRYLLHYYMHKNKFLWKIHKIHHSAKRLTPFTFYRIHPIESLLFGLRYSIVAGLVSGIFIYFFKANVNLVDILGVNVILFITHIIGDNLRHSHVPFSYPKWLEKIFISPRQHQIHHARIPRLHHSNFGGVLAIWDYMFNTINYSKETKPFFFGLKQNDKTILDLLKIK